jgi:hypothetical protein
MADWPLRAAIYAAADSKESQFDSPSVRDKTKQISVHVTHLKSKKAGTYEGWLIGARGID